MTEEHLRKISLFFFFVTLSESQARDLSRQCYSWCLSKKNKNPKMNSDTILILGLSRFWDQIKNKPRLGVSQVSQDSGWILPPQFKLEPWIAFQKNASEEEIFAALLFRVLKYSPEVISESLGITSGTLRYRVAKAVRRIGKFVLEQGSVF